MTRLLTAAVLLAGCSAEPPVDPMTLMDPDPRIAAANFLDAEAGDRPAVEMSRLEDAVSELVARYPGEAKALTSWIWEARIDTRRERRIAALRRVSASLRRAAAEDADTATILVSPAAAGEAG